MESNGIEAERMPLSGALGKKYSNDIHFKINGKTFTVENKRRADGSFNRVRKLTESNVLYVPELGYLMNQENFLSFINGNPAYSIVEHQDKNFRYIHQWFAQDGADVVSMDERRKEFVFCVSEQAYEKIKEVS